MGGAVRTVAKAVGVQKSPVQVAADTLNRDKPVQKASQSDMEMGARRRGARARGRQLLSDARLGSQDETLGGGNSLGS